MVTLVNEPGEEAGAIALGASLAMAGSVARRVVLVRGGLGAAIRPVLLHAFWDEVEETEGVRCSAAALLRRLFTVSTRSSSTVALRSRTSSSLRLSAPKCTCDTAPSV